MATGLGFALATTISIIISIYSNLFLPWEKEDPIHRGLSGHFAFVAVVASHRYSEAYQQGFYSPHRILAASGKAFVQKDSAFVEPRNYHHHHGQGYHDRASAHMDCLLLK